MMVAIPVLMHRSITVVVVTRVVRLVAPIVGGAFFFRVLFIEHHVVVVIEILVEFFLQDPLLTAVNIVSLVVFDLLRNLLKLCTLHILSAIR